MLCEWELPAWYRLHPAFQAKVLCAVHRQDGGKRLHFSPAHRHSAVAVAVCVCVGGGGGVENLIGCAQPCFVAAAAEGLQQRRQEVRRRKFELEKMKSVRPHLRVGVIHVLLSRNVFPARLLRLLLRRCVPEE